MKSAGQRESQKQEKRIATKYGGRVTAASGAFWSQKGDVRSDRFLFEAKLTSKNSISLKKEWLDKIEKEAVMESKIPVLSLSLGGRNYVILLEDDWDELIEE